MSDALQVFDMTVGARSGGFLFYQHTLPTCVVERILLTWPPGCVGLVKAVIFCGGNKVYPPENNQYLQFDSYTFDFAVSNQPDSGDWGIQIANDDYVPHTLHMVYLYNYFPAIGTSPLSQPISL